MEYTTTVTVTLLLWALSSAIPAVLAGDKFTVVKEPACSKEKVDDLFPVAMAVLLGKLVAETPKHAAKEGGGYSFTSKKMELKQKGEGAASCDGNDKAGKDKDECRSCLAFAMGKLTAECGDKTSGDVELKGCKMSFKKD